MDAAQNKDQHGLLEDEKHTSEAEEGEESKKLLDPPEEGINNHVTRCARMANGSASSRLNICGDLSLLTLDEDGGKVMTREEPGGEEEGSESEADVAPDGGWGWVVCFGSFVINFILDGTLFSFGVLMLDLVTDLGEDKGTTSWIGSAQMGIHMLMGPVISVLLQNFSIRQVVLLGSFIGSGGFIVSVFAPNVLVLIFTYGVVGGIGIGFVFLPAVIVLVPYFSRRRAIATGVATSGSGLGVFAYAWITDLLLEHFNWRGTVLILGGLMLNCLVFGSLFRPLPKGKSKKIKTDKQRNGNNTHRESEAQVRPISNAKFRKSHENGISTKDHTLGNGGHCLAPGDTSLALKIPSCQTVGEQDKGSQTLAQRDSYPSAHLSSTQQTGQVDRDAHGECSKTSVCDSKSPASLTGSGSKDLTTIEKVSPYDVITSGVHEVHKDAETADDTLEIPLIIQTPPSPAILPDSKVGMERTSKAIQLLESLENEILSVFNSESDQHDELCQTQASSGNSKPSPSLLPVNCKQGDNCITCYANGASVFPASASHLHGDTADSIAVNIASKEIPSPDKLIGRSCQQQETNMADRGHNCHNGTSNSIGSRNSLTNDSLNNAPSSNGDVAATPGDIDASTNVGVHSEGLEIAESPSLSKFKNLWLLKEPTSGKFSISRIYSSADHIHNLKSGVASNNSNNPTGVKNRLSNSHLNPQQSGQHGHALSPLVANHKTAEFGKSQTVSLYGINGYSSLHPHYRNKHHLNNNNHHHHHHHHHHRHSYYNLGGSRVEIVEHLNRGLSGHIPRGSSQHLAAYHYFGSMASFGATMTHASSTENVDVIRADTHNKGCHSCCLYFNKFFPLRLLKDAHFLLLLLGFTMWTAQSITMTYLPDYAVSLGIERTQAAFLISIIGIANVLGRPVAGFITDCMSISSIWLYTCALFLAAVANFAIPLCTSYHLLAACSGIFGLCMAVAVSMRTIVLADQMGVDVLTESFGIVALFQGIAFVITPPIAGTMIDKFNSSKPSFWLTAGMYTVSGTAMLSAACLSRRRTRCEEIAMVEVNSDGEVHV